MAAQPTDSSALRAYLDDAKQTVETALDRLLPAEADGAPRLAEAVRYSVFAGGKRLRPALAFAAAEAVGGDRAVAVPFACALELVHTYSLIHDDLPAMDDDDLRRGRPTSHKVFGEAHAILAGDCLHTMAFGILLRETQDATLARALGVALADAAGFAGMVGGQVEDLAAEHGTPNAEQLYRIHRGKTAALIQAATRGGGLAGGADAATVDALGAYGLHLGLAFQLVDDVLDETGTAEALGKTPGKDRQDEKLTVVALEGLEAARERARQEVAAAIEAVAGLPHPERLVDLAHFVRERDR
ncbi:MAG: polyprenyl synthetase family protein [Planctomycetota bacterium]|nr:polyprenyl synthetase family protein [Planctomycetota bacterium]